MKLDARDIKRFLAKTKLFSELELTPKVRRLEVSHPLEQTTLISFTLNDIQMGILLDQTAETETEILNQVKQWGGLARLLKPSNGENHFMLEGKSAYLLTTKTTRERLDRRLTELYPSYSRSQLASLIKQGKVLVDNKTVTKANFLVENETIHVEFPRKQAIEFPILWQDDDFIAINKPAGILSHELNQIDAEWTVDDFAHQHANLSASERAIAHRLDRDTSGVILAGKNPQAVDYLKNQFANRLVQKTYLAVSDHTPTPEHALINLPLKRSSANPGKQEVSSNGREALTEYKVLQVNGKQTLLEVKPKTGRTHQIRVHLAHVGAPILGDRLYGGTLAKRLMLHALSVKFTKPNGEISEIISPAPAEFGYGTN